MDKRIKIQTGVVKRMIKEVASYEKEVKDNEAKLQKMKDDNKDEYDIRKFEEVLGESHMMVPDSKGRLETAITTLQAIITEAESTGEPIDETIKADANAILAEAGAGEESY